MKNVSHTLTGRTLLLAAMAGAPALMASTDYGPAVWYSSSCTKYYTSGNGKQMFVCHMMEGYYATMVSWQNNCSITVSAHYGYNSVQQSGDYAAREIGQFVRDDNYAWTQGCWNRYCMSIEHEGFCSNPSWFTDTLYQDSAALAKSKAEKYGFAKDRNHIIGHNEKSNSAWAAWSEANITPVGTFDAHCNTHSDPGAYWNWSTYMSYVNANVINPPYLFNADSQGFTAGNGMSAVSWTGTGWPGCIYSDQTGGDAFLYSPSTSYTGGGNAVVNVSVYPQNGSTANHDMQLFWKTSSQNYYDAAKSSPCVSYTCQNNWIRLNLNVNNSLYYNQAITGLRLDFDNANSGTRYIVNHVIPQSSLLWWFDSDAMGWTPGNAVTGITWTGSGWPGIIYFDQTGNDAFIYADANWFNLLGTYRYLGGANDKIHVRVYPQSGSTASHNMQVFWITLSDQAWNANKSSSIVYYTAQNQWIDVYIPVGANPLWCGGNNASDGIQNIRLDLDNSNTGTRWIIDSITIEQ